MKIIKLKIDGIKCSGCINRIINVLESIKGIINYSFDDLNILTLIVKKEKVITDLCQKIENLGFQVTII